ncbi:MAG: methyltransferase domain-containing protein [Thermodesulfovibrionales bacterium]
MRNDLPERCLYWVRTLLEYKLPPAKVLELGSAHGGFVAMLRWASYDATGLELSPWLVEFARSAFGVPMLAGPIEDQNIADGSLDAIVLMDVLEHLPEPLSTLRKCLSLLKPDGVIVIQTPCFPERGSYDQLIADDSPFLEQLKSEEHLYLFSRKSIGTFLEQLGAAHIHFEPAIFSHYDMFLVASRQPLKVNDAEDISAALMASTSGRLVLALLDKDDEKKGVIDKLGDCEADRAARLDVINLQAEEYARRIEAAEAERAVSADIIQNQGKMLESQGQTLEGQKQTLESQGRMFESQHQMLETQGQLLETQGQLLEAMRASLTWKATAPLRRLHGQLTGKKALEDSHVDRLMRKYGTNRAYTEYFWNHFNEIHKHNKMFDIYLETELGSLNRSRNHTGAFCEYFGDRTLFSGKECLDIGCSSGNSLIAFAEREAARAIGIEVSSGRYKTALVNAAGCPETLRSRLQLLNADIQTIDPGHLGSFDIIFCNDVLEHVVNPAEVVEKICLLMKDLPGAFTFVNLRNFQNPRNVLHEPHYDMPCLSLLPYELAVQYYNCCRQDTALAYEVRQWDTFENYRAMFEVHGKRCTFFGETVPALSVIDQVVSEAREIQPIFENYCREHRVPDNLRISMNNYLLEYLSGIEDMGRACNEDHGIQLMQAFYLKYGVFNIDMMIMNKEP